MFLFILAGPHCKTAKSAKSAPEPGTISILVKVLCIQKWLPD